jgi:Na+(H+)/acetate symporter ActP
MQLSWVDWLVIVVYFLVNLAIGIYYYRRASTSVGEFFISGRDVPWWLTGASMVAATFGADTPLRVAGSFTWPCSALVRSSSAHAGGRCRLCLLHLLGPRTTGLENFEPVEC